MDREFYWNNIFLHPSDTNMSDANIAAEDTSILNTRSSNGSSSSQHFRIGGSPNEEDNILSLEDAEIDLNSNEIDDGQPFSFPLSANRNNEPLDQGHNAAHVGIGGEASESRLFSCPYVPSLLEQDRGLSSSYSDASSSGLNGSMSGDFNDEPGSSLDGRRVTCKRKNTEIFPGSSSASGSAYLFHLSGSCPFAPVSNNSSTGINISSPSNYTTGASSSQGQLNTRLSTIIRGAVPNAESSERSFRHRVNPAQQNDFLPPNLYMSRDTVHDSIWAHNEPSFNFISFNRRLESGPVAASSSMQQQPQMSVRPTLPQNANLNPWTSTPSSRNGNSPSSLNSSETWRSIREETVMMNLPRNNILDQPLLVPDRETRGARQEMVANGSAASTAGNSSGIQSSVGSTWVSNQNPPTQLSQNLPRSLADAVQETLLASSGPAGHSATTQGPVDHAASFFPRIQQPQVRSAQLLDRQNDDVPLPLMRLASREGRNRMISEIRNALDVMRRGENLRFEDVFMFDHPLFHGVADLHDRHRDMRLDVDNMSYEELLALEERIGDVNTGLGEETILKSLRQWKHSPVRAGTTADMEPCCICQEEYVEGEDLGALDCRHDFHTACIKPWLMQKNLCPICKTTAVVT